MKIGVFFGSKSPEHDVSIITAQLIIKNLIEMGYDVVPVYLSKSGKWYAGEKFGSIDLFKVRDYEKSLENEEFTLDLSVQKKLVLKKKGLLSSRKYEIDFAFPAFHGQNGEDGSVQGLFELLNIPYVGCDVASSAVAMDKVLTKLFYKSLNVPTSPFVFFEKNKWEENREDVIKGVTNDLRYPVFVKPARLGSSIGITKVKEESELEFAIEVAFHYDSKILVEEGVENLIDLTVCVIGGREVIASEVQQSLYSKDFFSYEDKYISEGGAQTGNAEKKIIIPAEISLEETEFLQNTSMKIFKSLGCSGISRFDFLYNSKDKKIFANEINTIPGTLYHHLWKASGVQIQKLLEILIDTANDNYKTKEKKETIFESSILSSTNSAKFGNKLN